MSKVHHLLEEYGESHRSPVNKKVHWICVPAIMISLIGLIWLIPFPQSISKITVDYLPLNWAIIFIALAMIYYFRLSVSLAVGMILVTAALLFIGWMVATLIPLPLWASCLVIFTLAWIGQFWGHKIEGKKPSFLKDVQFLLIGPVWLLSFVYRKIGIRF